MRKRVISIITVLSLLLAIIVPSSAISNQVIVDPMSVDEETMINELKEQLPKDEAELLKLGLIEASSLGRCSNSRASGNTYGPYRTLSMPGYCANIVINGWKNGSYTTASYDGTTCYKFQFGSDIVYVQTTAFYPTQATYDQYAQFPSDQTISNEVTNQISANNRGAYYSSRWRIERHSGSNAVVQFELYGTSVSIETTDYLLVSHKLECTTGVGVTGVSFSRTPTLKLELCNAGSGNLYFNSYQMFGRGTNRTIQDFSSFLTLGISAIKLVGAISSNALTLSLFSNVFSSALNLDPTSSSIWNSSITIISNPARDIYTYLISAKSPSSLTNQADYFQYRIGLCGTADSSVSYRFIFNS